MMSRITLPGHWYLKGIAIPLQQIEPWNHSLLPKEGLFCIINGIIWLFINVADFISLPIEYFFLNLEIYKFIVYNVYRCCQLFPQPLNIKFKFFSLWKEALVAGRKSSRCAGNGSASEWKKREGWENSTGQGKDNSKIILIVELQFGIVNYKYK